MQFINKYQGIVTNEKNSLYKDTVYLSIINQLFLNLNSVINFLNSIENAVTFARLGIVHPDILKINDLKLILKEFSELHDKSEILDLDLYNWYSIIKTNCYFSNETLIFVLEFPLTDGELFDYYHLFPIPTSNNTILIPTKPYMALSSTHYQYMETRCQNINNYYICPQEDLRSAPENDCVGSLLNGNPVHCTFTEIEQPKSSIEQINSDHLLVISKNQVKITSFCKDQELQIIQGRNLITIPKNCTIQINNKKYGNHQNQRPVSPLLLPSIEIHNKTDIKKLGKIKIENIPLSEMYNIQKSLNSLNPVTIDEINDNATTNWILWIILILIVLISVSIYLFLRFKRCNRSPARPFPAEIVYQSKPTPSVLFNPEVAF